MITLWHNPRCSKSRAALALIEDAGHPLTLRNYLTDPPTLAELKTAQAALNLPASEMIRKGEALFKDLALKGADDTTLLRAMADHPILIERPIAFKDIRAVIGRPTENLKSLL